jgi:NADH dehydrogenase
VVDSTDVEKVVGDILDPTSLRGTMAGCDAVIHLVGIIDEKPSKGITFESVHFEGTRAVVNEASRAGVERYVQMSANGARPNGVSAYQTSKWKAEEYVRNAAFRHWTVLRPSTIFGDPGTENPDFALQLAKQLVKPFPILPVFGRGDFKMQPISVEEVAAAFVQALAHDVAAGRSYCVAGKEEITFVDILDRITEAVGHAKKPKLPQPLWLMRPAVRTLGRIGLLPITPDQFEMLVEGNTCDSTDFYRDFDVVFRPFIPENLQYIRLRS